MLRALARAGMGTVIAASAGLALASAADAYGPCGTDSTGATACPIAISPSTVTGSITVASENDYYIFWAQRDTHLSVTVTDVEDATCSLGSAYTCGAVSASLLNDHGSTLTDTFSSIPDNGVSDPESLSATLGRGIYYLQVTGGPDTTGAPVPYTLSINDATTPAVHWPPLCIVPALAHDTSLARAKASLQQAYCASGRVTRAYSPHTRRGRVIELRPHVGAVEPYETKVHIVLSRGPRPPKRHRHRHRTAHRHPGR